MLDNASIHQSSIDSIDPSEVLRATFEKNVFIMMRYDDTPEFKQIFDQIKVTISETLRRFGLNPVIANEQILDSNLWEHVKRCMDICRFGIAVFEKINPQKPDFNPNIAIELGYMHAKDKPCLLLRENAIQGLFTDITGMLYEPFDAGKLQSSIREAIEKWAVKYLRISASEEINNRTCEDPLIERTRRIVDSLKTLASELGERSELTIRLAGHLSSLAISDDAFTAPEFWSFHDLLILERNTILSLLGRGATVKCILWPEYYNVLVRRRMASKEGLRMNVLPKYSQLINTLEQNRTNPRLQVVSTDRLSHDNLHIFGTQISFIGRSRYWDVGFKETTIIHDSATIRGMIADFDRDFQHDAETLLTRSFSGQDSQFLQEITDLKILAIEELRHSKSRLEEYVNSA